MEETPTRTRISTFLSMRVNHVLKNILSAPDRPDGYLSIYIERKMQPVQSSSAFRVTIGDRISEG